MKTKLQFFSLQLLINIAIAKIIDIIIYKIIDSNISKYINLNFFMYSKELIISLVIILIVVMFNN
jgi:hypothetical protein